MLFSRAAPIVLFHDGPAPGKEFRLSVPLPGPVQRYGLGSGFEIAASVLYWPFRSFLTLHLLHGCVRLWEYPSGRAWMTN